MMPAATSGDAPSFWTSSRIEMFPRASTGKHQDNIIQHSAKHPRRGCCAHNLLKLANAVECKKVDAASMRSYGKPK
jgi:hypothetical protein